MFGFSQRCQSALRREYSERWLVLARDVSLHFEKNILRLFHYYWDSTITEQLFITDIILFSCCGYSLWCKMCVTTVLKVWPESTVCLVRGRNWVHHKSWFRRHFILISSVFHTYDYCFRFGSFVLWGVRFVKTVETAYFSVKNKKKVSYV